ncbi:MAG: DNA polymerase III subunit delta' [Rubrivivax sp.]|nr:DNA polymerase III subunit delta' [Rubrivivax sp.]
MSAERPTTPAPSELIEGGGRLPLPWLVAPLTQALAVARGHHALLLRAAPGIGARALALSLAQSRLCEAPGPNGLACGGCASCRLVHAHAHPDLFVLLPEIERRQTAWLIGEDKPEAEEGGKRKPSRQIRIDDVRVLLDWVTKTAARGRGKVVLLHPAEALNAHAASALLKTLEEPPAAVQLVLTCSDAMHLLPTVRSRCQQVVVPPPGVAEAAAWLAAQGVVRPEVLLAACDGRPLEVLACQERGVDAERWAALPAELAAGRPGALAGADVPLALQWLLKVCHDAMAAAVGAPGRYFAEGAMPDGLALAALNRWHRELQRLALAAEHPWHEALALDALVSGARLALSAPGRRPGDMAPNPSRTPSRAGA